MKALLTVIASVAGCAGPALVGPVEMKSAPGSGISVAWTSHEYHPIDKPIAVGGTVMDIVSAGHGTLLIVALDPATGHFLWWRPMTPSRITPGVKVSVCKVGDDRVAYLRATPVGDAAELVVANAATGDDLAVSPLAYFTSGLWVCGNGRDVCTSARTMKAGVSELQRFDVTTGRFVSEGPPRARELGDGLLDLGDRPGNTLGVLRDDEIAWRTPAAAAFPADFSSDNGWAWTLYAAEGVYAGSVYGPSAQKGKTRVGDLATSATAGLSAKTGEVLWRDTGSRAACNVGTDDQPVRCRARGTAIGQPGQDVSFRDLDVTVEGFDVATGRTTWSVALGSAPEVLFGRKQPAIAGVNRAVLTSPNGPIILDDATGAIAKPTPDQTFWCMLNTRYESQSRFQWPDGTWDNQRPGGVVASICDARGDAATTIPSADATRAAGAVVGTYAVIATDHGFTGFKLP